MTLPLFSGAPEPKAPPGLRPYQQRAITNIKAQIIFGNRRILAVGPTGCGKMLLIAAMIRTSRVPAIFVAHRMELIDQCVDQLARLGVTQVGVLRGDDERYDPGASTQVCSVQTLARRDKPFVALQPTESCPYPQLIFVDEAHRSSSESYVEHVFKAYPHAIIIGFTATPTRLDGRPLGGELYQDIVQIATYAELLKNPDWLATPDIFDSQLQADLSEVRIAGSDFDDVQLAQVMHTDRLEGHVVEHWLKLANRHPIWKNGMRVPLESAEGEYRRTLLFAVNVAHSESLTARFEAAGVKVAHLDGTTPEAQRRAMLRALGQGELRVVCNCNVAVEGVDVPEVKCIVHARPTQSLTMWRQACGRAMRPWRGVTPLILDHGGNFMRLGCPFEDLRWSLSSKPVRASKPGLKLCRKCFAYVPLGRSMCPFCGYEFQPEDERVIQESSAELSQRSTDPESLKRDFFNRQAIIARTRGFKPGFASKLYLDRYGDWPPKEWSDRVKADFLTDPAWQSTMARRLERKAVREAQDKREEAALRSTPAPAPAVVDPMAKIREQFAKANTQPAKSPEITPEMMNGPCTQCGGIGVVDGDGQEEPCPMCSEPEMSYAEKWATDTDSLGEREETFSDWLEDQGVT